MKCCTMIVEAEETPKAKTQILSRQFFQSDSQKELWVCEMKLKPLFPPPPRKTGYGPIWKRGKKEKNFGLSFPFLRSCLIFNFSPSFSQLIRKRSIDSSQMIYLTKKKNANKTLNMFFFISGREKSNC